MSESTGNDLAAEYPDELVVDSRYRDVVANELVYNLKVWQDTKENEETDDNLQLVLFKNLTDLDAYSAVTRPRYANEIAALETPARQFTSLDVLLYDLRTRFAADHGYVPEMGKNRDATVGFPQHKGVPIPPRPASRPPSDAPANAGRPVHIGVVDVPLYPHPDFPAETVLTAGAVPDWTVYAEDRYYVPVWAGHGTFVVGMIRQQAPGATITVRGGLSYVTGTNTAWATAQAIASFRNARPSIVNLSLGCVTLDNQPPMVIRRAIDRLGSDVLVLAAAGNRANAKNPPDHIWPAAMTDVIAVGATGAEFSPDKPWVDCTAEGDGVTSAYVFDTLPDSSGPVSFEGYATWSGTSFATATVTGAIAARMTQGTGLPAKDALAALLADPASVVKEYVHRKQ
jgi:subtilisin family serine protease